jgi:hypothetical protein
MRFNNLKELRKHLEPIGEQYKNIIRNNTYIRFGERGPLSGWKVLRIVVVCDGKDIRCCVRTDKSKDDKEIAVIRKPSELPLSLKEVGLSDKQWDRITAKCALWLERNGMYPHRDVITDKTGSLFDD